MKKNIDIRNRIVDMYDVDIAMDAKEIIKYLDKNMKIRFFSVRASYSKYVFTGRPEDAAGGSITINGYRLRTPDDQFGVVIE